MRGRLKNSETLQKLETFLVHLSAERLTELSALIYSYPSLFYDTPGQTHLIEHDSDVCVPIRRRFYRVSEEKRKVMVSDKSPRFCTDYCKVNAVMKPDAYPLLRMGNCVYQVGSANYVSTFDLLKGFPIK